MCTCRTSVDVSLTVRERPEIIAQPVDTMVCEGAPARFEVDAGVTTGVAYQWQVNMNDGNGFNDIERFRWVSTWVPRQAVPAGTDTLKAGLTVTSTG